MLGSSFLFIADEGLVEGGVKGFITGGEFLNQFVVKLLAVEVGLCHPDADGIAKREDVAGLTTDKAEVLIVEVEGFVTQIADGDEAFAVVIVNLGIDAKFGHSADVGIILLTNLVCHELDLLVLDAGTFGTGCQLFHL